MVRSCHAAYEKLLPHQPRAYQAQVPWLADFTAEEVRYAMIAVRREARASLEAKAPQPSSRHLPRHTPHETGSSSPT